MKKIIVSLLVCGMLFWGGIANSQTVDQSALLEQISKLKAQIALLQQILTLTQQIEAIKSDQSAVSVSATGGTATLTAGQKEYYEGYCQRQEEFYNELQPYFQKCSMEVEFANSFFYAPDSKKILDAVESCLGRDWRRVSETNTEAKNTHRQEQITQLQASGNFDVSSSAYRDLIDIPDMPEYLAAKEDENNFDNLRRLYEQAERICNQYQQ